VNKSEFNPLIIKKYPEEILEDKYQAKKLIYEDKYFIDIRRV